MAATKSRNGKSRSRSKSKGIDENDPLNDWVKSTKPTSTVCQTCANKDAAEALRRCLQAMIKHNATHITQRQLLAKVKDLCPDYEVGMWGFRNHLKEHEGELYRRAKGEIE